MDKAEIRLLSRIKINPETGCWEWLGAKNTTGYGQTYAGGRQITTHRLSYIIEYGGIPKDACILHSCDNKKCCNPEHLMAGTAADNSRDAVARGRYTNTKLTDNQVREIRASKGITSQAQVAKKLGVTESLVSQIINGKARHHVH